VPKLAADPDHKKFHQYYIADIENNLLDAHHAWASIHILGLLQNRQYGLHVKRAMVTTDRLLELAHEFTSVVGIEAKEGV
jgi:hypothetical protein